MIPCMLVHVDTDFGGDPDDACAVAMLLGWPDVEIVGVTTNLDPGGTRAGCVCHLLSRVGRDDIAVAAGSGASLTTLKRYESTWAIRATGPNRWNRGQQLLVRRWTCSRRALPVERQSLRSEHSRTWRCSR